MSEVDFVGRHIEKCKYVHYASGPWFQSRFSILFVSKNGQVTLDMSIMSVENKTPRLDLTLEQTRYLQERGGKPRVRWVWLSFSAGLAATQVFTIEVLIQSASTNW